MHNGPGSPAQTNMDSRRMFTMNWSSAWMRPDGRSHGNDRGGGRAKDGKYSEERTDKNRRSSKVLENFDKRAKTGTRGGIGVLVAGHGGRTFEKARRTAGRRPRHH
eukprot:4855399-Pyramimonas_sp.AAC.1